MGVIKTSVFQLLEQFPDHGEDIKQQFKASQEFQSMCEDYRQCSEALQHWNQSNDKHARARRLEYKQLLQELVDEIRSFLHSSR